uniref:Putative integral to membrane n=2 Tax=Ixodes ricinus TaxID=34613 RepID=V5GLR5_IXORI
MKAVIATVWAILAQLYSNGCDLLFNAGAGYLFRYLVAVGSLSYSLARRGRRFLPVDPSEGDDPVHINAVCSPLEWQMERPRPSSELSQAQDRLFFYGCNAAGQRMVVCFSRFKNQVAELWLCLYAADGCTYTLPCTFTLDRSDGNTFTALGLRLECLAANRRWRLAFNGTLRKCIPGDSGGADTTEAHVKFGFIWSTVSHTLEQPVELSCALLAESFAKLPTPQMLAEIDSFLLETDSYDQGGMMSGEVTIEGTSAEWNLWGSKVRTRGAVVEDTRVEDHHFGFLENGNIYHVVHTDKYGGAEGLYYGSLYAPELRMLPIDYGLIRTQDLISGSFLRMYIGFGSIQLSIHARHKSVALTFGNEESACEVQVAAADLECDQMHGKGFTVRVQRKGPTTYRISEHFKHKGVRERSSTDPDPLVAHIGEACCKSSDLTGGKGSSLAVLHSIAEQFKTFTVPDAFVVTTSSYKMFSLGGEFQRLVQQIKRCGLRGDTQAALKETCSSVVSAMEKLPLPDLVEKEIARCMKKYGDDLGGKRFAVRSSAIGEDSEDMSAAGQMTTFLGVRSLSKVLECVVKCWASQFSFTSINYKRQYGQPMDSPMAVVIQEMVNAEVAGVMFTCDPLTGNPAYITVTANYGLGESVVSASAEPDTYVLKRTPGMRPVLESVQVGHKSLYTTQSESDGVVMLPVTEDKTKEKCLENDQVENLVFVGTQIEKCHTTPQDIEWAVCGGKIYMLQCRPVTTFFRESDSELTHELDTGLKCEKEAFTKANICEVLPGATSPLSLSVIRLCFDTYCRDLYTGMSAMYPHDPSFYMPVWMPIHRYNYFLWLSDGQMNLRSDANVLEKSMMYNTLGRDITGEIMKNGCVDRQKKTNIWKLPQQMYYLLKMLFTTNKRLKRISAATQDLHLSVDGMLSASQMYTYLSNSLHHLREPSDVLVSAFASSSMYNLILQRILAAASGDLTPQVFAEFSKMLTGGDVESAEVPRSIQELGTLLAASTDKENFLSMSIEEACEWLMTVENPCGEKFRDFLHKHGHRNVKEFDLYTKPWCMDPSSLVKSLRAAAMAPKSTTQKEAPSWDLSDLPYKLTFVQKLLLKFLIPRARLAVAARETSKSGLVRTIHKLRTVCIRLADQMVLEGRIPTPDLLYFLTFEEIGILLKTRSPSLVLKAQRRLRLHPELDKVKYPSLFVGVPKPIMTAAKRIEGDFEMKGNPMSQGVAEGYARVVPTFEEAHLIRKGDILVTTATDTGWTPYFPLLSGVITEMGGPLSHGAVVAREYGLPCVVGADGITSMLRTGDYILLDGNTGILRKLAKPADEDP